MKILGRSSLSAVLETIITISWVLGIIGLILVPIYFSAVFFNPE
jgi:hypothetical protein